MVSRAPWAGALSASARSCYHSLINQDTVMLVTKKFRVKSLNTFSHLEMNFLEKKHEKCIKFTIIVSPGGGVETKLR